MATFNVADDPNVKVILQYYPPTYKSDNASTNNATPATWTLSEQGQVKLVIQANEVTAASAAILSTTGHVLNNATDLNSIPGTSVSSAVNNILFDANAWTAWADCAISFTKEKIGAKVATVSHEVTFEKPKHIDLVENGYSKFTLTSNLDNIRIDDVKYVVTK